MTTTPQATQHTPISPQFEMLDKDDETKNTHLWLVNRATDVASHHAVMGSAIVQFMHSHAPAIHQGLWDADNSAPYNDPIGAIPTYKSHFYDPSTGRNYLGESDPTALTRGRQYFDEALACYWNGNMEQAAYRLGLSLHYLTDCSQPMHATNFTNIDKPLMYHQGFEEYVITWLKANPITPPGYKQSLTSTNPNDYIIEAAKRSATHAGAITGQVTLTAWQNVLLHSQWSGLVEPVMKPMLLDSIEVVSQYLVLWMTQATSRPVWQPNTVAIDEGQTVDLMALPSWDFARADWRPQGHAVNSEASAASKQAATTCDDRGNTDSASRAMIGQCFMLTGPGRRDVKVGLSAHVGLSVSSHLTADGTASLSIWIIKLSDALNLWDHTDPFAFEVHNIYNDSQQTQHVVPDPTPVNSKIVKDLTFTLAGDVSYIVLATLNTNGTSSALGSFALGTSVSFARLTIAA